MDPKQRRFALAMLLFALLSSSALAFATNRFTWANIPSNHCQDELGVGPTGVFLLGSSSSSSSSSEEQTWEAMFQHLEDHKGQFGHCDVAPSIDPDLAEWVSAQRRYHQRDMLSTDRIQRLKSIGFQFWKLPEEEEGKKSIQELQNISWDQKYQELVLFQQEYGHCDVPAGDDANQALAIWVIAQREWRCRKDMPAERIQWLDAIGFDWQSENYFFGETWSPKIQQLWDRKFLELAQFREEHGHFNVPPFYQENPSLDFFVKYQKMWRSEAWGEYPKLWRKGLDVIGFTWDRSYD